MIYKTGLWKNIKIPNLLNIFLAENGCYFFSFVCWKFKNSNSYKIWLAIENTKTRRALSRTAQRKVSNWFFCLNFAFDFFYFTELKADERFLKTRCSEILAKILKKCLRKDSVINNWIVINNSRPIARTIAIPCTLTKHEFFSVLYTLLWKGLAENFQTAGCFLIF